MTHQPFKAVGDRVRVYQRAVIVGHEHMEIGSDVIVDDLVMIVAKDATIIGNFVHIGAFSSIMGGGQLAMGDFSGLSAGVRLWTGNDDYSGGALTNPTVPEEFRNAVRSFINIGRHAILGTNAVVLPGVTIGEGAVVGANSLVTRDLEPWTINVGSPTRVVKMRRELPIRELERQLLERMRGGR